MPYVPKDIPTATCIRIECNGKVYTIGTDKIGHFFQQGHMLYEISVAPLGPTGLEGPAYAKGFAQYTEGLPISPAVPGCQEWLNHGSFAFFGLFDNEAIKLSSLRERWGGRVVPRAVPQPWRAQRSEADVAANLSGMRFWSDLMRGKFTQSGGFDICDYINRAWVE